MKACEKIKTELTLNEHDGIILRGSRIVLPESLRLKAIQIAHAGHQGLVKTKQLLREKVWYPGIDKLGKHTVDYLLVMSGKWTKQSPSTTAHDDAASSTRTNFPYKFSKIYILRIWRSLWVCANRALPQL